MRTGFNNLLPFSDSFFDFIISWNVIHYLDHYKHDIGENIDETSRVLMKNGYFIGSVPGPGCYSLLGAKKVYAHQVRINPSTNSAGEEVCKKIPFTI
ncbi:class I SAM-dependent methyltransferase [Methylophilaceae bacterium]|nr:class I SAM-dependent methyltransferase [Methylophilaceae bacterium]